MRRGIGPLRIAALLALVFQAVLASGAADAATTSKWRWTQQSGQESAMLFDAATVRNGVKIAVGESGVVQRSATPGEWRIVPFPGKDDLTAIASNGETAVALDVKALHRTTDGLVWSEGKQLGSLTLEQIDSSLKGKKAGKTKLNFGNINWKDVIWDGRQFVASGLISTMDELGHVFPVIAVSSEGIEWMLHPIGVAGSWFDDWALKLVLFKGQWYAISPGFTFQSNDLSRWTYSDVQSLNGLEILNAATDGDVIVLSTWSVSKHIGGYLMTSSDGKSYEPTLSYGSIGWGAVSWDGGQFVAGGDFGVVYVSADGRDWNDKTQQHGEIMGTLNYVAYKGLKSDIKSVIRTDEGYLAVGNVGAIRSSADLGQLWKLEAGGEMGNIAQLAYAPGIYAAGGNGTFMLSSDGKHWVSGDDKLFGEEIAIKELSRMNDMLVIVGSRRMLTNDNSGVFYIYRDGKMTAFNPPFADIKSIRAMNGTMYAYSNSGKWSASADGSSWKKLSGPPVVPLASNGKLWIGKGCDDFRTIYVSKEGRSWTRVKPTLDGKPTSGMDFSEFLVANAVWTGSKFVAVSNRTIMESTDGTRWKTMFNDTKDGYNLIALAVGDKGVMVAVGYAGLIYMCEDGKNWHLAGSPSKEELIGLIWDGKQFMAATKTGDLIVGRQ